ncbi:MAG TPA: Ig domain-containing protein, partial [Blastocatellia bacterium]|nr:Ig domain-containing protein [Blastocatellia bacterium]
SAQINVTGGVPTYQFSILSGSLPPGVTLNSNSGLISGTPTVVGTFSFTVKVTDQAGTTATRFYKILIR